MAVLKLKTRGTMRAGRDATIHIRASKQTKDLIETAAAVSGKTLSEFTLESARVQAVNVLLDQRLFALETKHHSAFVKALDNPPPAGAKLKVLMKRRPLWQS